MHATLPLLQSSDFPAIRRQATATLQVNLGYRCNQSCVHCHVNAGPNRTEMMDAETMALIPQVLAARGIGTLPQSLKEACDALEADPLFGEVLGNEIVGEFIKLKRMEWVEYSRHVSDWEIQRYTEFF